MIARGSGLRPAKRQAGFALVVTLTLLAFVVVLLVGLATYTRIETAIAGNSQRQAQARNNALVALEIALAQLQRHAGPDRRITAGAASFGGGEGTQHFTGVWDATTEDAEPIVWLVSGNETDPKTVTPESAIAAAVELVGRNTSGHPGAVVVPLVDFPSAESGAPRGRYAWWVGDSALRAPVAAPRGKIGPQYGPYASPEMRSRIGQQLGGGAAPVEFEPAAPENERTAANATTQAQLAFMAKSDGSRVGLERVRERYFAWTTDNAAVLADTLRGGLRIDLSAEPERLGAAFARWADYRATMEDPDAPATPAPLPVYESDPLRRRYRFAPGASADTPGVAPVVTYFYLLFGVRKQNAAAPYTLSLRWAAALWNPYTSAFVPEDLRLEISGLPDLIDFVAANTNAVNATVSLRQLYGEPLKVTLPWPTTSPTRADQHSWLPGRVYNWVNQANAPLDAAGERAGRFNSRDLGGFADGLTLSVPGTTAVNGNTPLSLRLNGETTLTVRLVRARDGALLATYRSPTYDAVTATAPEEASRNRSQLGFLFRLAESFDSVNDPGRWLTTTGVDPRSTMLPADALRAVPNGPNPAAYANYITISAPDRLLDRDITRGTSYNEDVPVFELPRGPLLSLGQLQHLFVPGARPFAIGNSWGSTATVNGIAANEVFDRFFVSGLTPEIAATMGPEDAPPNARLRPSGSAAAALAESDAQTFSARHLQHGAFNVNATSAAAWAAVLRAGRAAAAGEFSFLDANATTGTATDGARLSDAAPGAAFYRFAHSAQEVFKADADYRQSTTSTTATGPAIATHLFRRGRRVLSEGEVEALAQALAAAIAAKHARSGPYRSMAEFLNPSPALGGQSAIERAIAEAGINAPVSEFSSHWLTQGDAMTMLAPFLFPRSDTFVIRAYGEAVNPATRAAEGRAWCEAVVQRMPEYVDTADAPQTAPEALTSGLNRIHGRRLRVVSFRWLTRYDL